MYNNKKNKGPQYANSRSMVPQPRPTNAPASSQRPTPRPATVDEIMAARRGNRSAEMSARQEENLRRR